jgi:hypothetical protein
VFTAVNAVSRPCPRDDLAKLATTTTFYTIIVRPYDLVHSVRADELYSYLVPNPLHLQNLRCPAHKRRSINSEVKLTFESMRPKPTDKYVAG